MAINEVNKKAISGKYVGNAYWANTQVTFDKFDDVELESNGVKTKATPIKIKSTSIICFYNANWYPYPTTSYTTINNEVSIDVYRNEVNDLKFKVIDDKSAFGSQNNYIASSKRVVSGTLKNIDIKNRSLLLGTNQGDFPAMIVDENMGKLISAYFKIGDVVRAHVDDQAPHAYGFNRVLFIDPK